MRFRSIWIWLWLHANQGRKFFIHIPLVNRVLMLKPRLISRVLSCVINFYTHPHMREREKINVYSIRWDCCKKINSLRIIKIDECLKEFFFHLKLIIIKMFGVRLRKWKCEFVFYFFNRKLSLNYMMTLDYVRESYFRCLFPYGKVLTQCDEN